MVSLTEAKAGDTKTGAGRGADATTKIGNEAGSVTKTVIERDAEKAAATEIQRIRRRRGPASQTHMSLS